MTDLRTPRAKIATQERSWRDGQAATRIYVWPENESIMENFTIGRRARPVDAFREVVLGEVLPKLDVADAKVKWSRKAGCGCGCSPGFILTDLDGRVRTLRQNGAILDLHVTITGCEHEFNEWACTKCGLPNPEAMQTIAEVKESNLAEQLRRQVEADKAVNA